MIAMRIALLGCSLLALAFGTPSIAGVRIYAAASLTAPLTAAAAEWRQLGHAPPELVFGGSGALARQLAAGAPADLFISADPAWMDRPEVSRRLSPGSRGNLVGNRLVIVSPRARPFALEMRAGFAIDRAFRGRWCTGDPAAVPAGRYAREALQGLGWWNTLAPRLVGTEDVRAALALVARGECAMGVVYRSDAQGNREVTTLGLVPDRLHSPIVYPASALRGASPEALAFLRWLRSAAGLAHFREAGFSLPEP